MAKTQSFGDKLKKQKKESEKVSVKVIKGFRSNDGSTRFVEQFVKIDDINAVDKVDIK
ncbi:MAG: hypothetical protein ACLFR2_00810 [Candidatus Kapaibacterium sp.]